MTKTEFRRLKHVHFFGIGGIGVSALAQALAYEGKQVSGQDTAASPMTEKLRKEAVVVSIGQKISAIPDDADALVHSSALLERDTRFVEKLKKIGKPVLSYSEALGLYSAGKFTIAVAGTHGKTTTTAMLAEMLVRVKADPTVIVGSLLKRVQSNFIGGKSRYFVVEADDYRRQFLSLEPRVLVITNIGKDHLDYYTDIADIQSAFRALAQKVPANGFVIANHDDPLIREALVGISARIVNYREFMKERIPVSLPGVHNQENAACALAVARILHIPEKKACEALTHFSGAWRRFDQKGVMKNGALVYDDYAHNPDKVRAAIAGFREVFPGKRLVVAFQPHLYSRTKTLLDDFARAFDGADQVFVLPIFAAREKNDRSIKAQHLVERIELHKKEKGLEKPEVSFVGDMKKLSASLKRKLTNNDVIVAMGAGDVYKLADDLMMQSK